MKLKIFLKDPNSNFPTTANNNDIGLDLIAIKKFKTIRKGFNTKKFVTEEHNIENCKLYNLGETILYDTGIICLPEEGYYTEIVPRSSLSKTGWVLSNSIGIIDPDYRGTLLIALTRIDPTAKEIPLPFCKAQLIVKKKEIINVERITIVNSTSRGTGGFGSTGERI